MTVNYDDVLLLTPTLWGAKALRKASIAIVVGTGMCMY